MPIPNACNPSAGDQSWITCWPNWWICMTCISLACLASFSGDAGEGNEICQISLLQQNLRFLLLFKLVFPEWINGLETAKKTWGTLKKKRISRWLDQMIIWPFFIVIYHFIFFYYRRRCWGRRQWNTLTIVNCVQ